MRNNAIILLKIDVDFFFRLNLKDTYIWGWVRLYVFSSIWFGLEFNQKLKRIVDQRYPD